MVALPALFAASCGGTDFFNTDGGIDQATGTGSCPQGTVIYRLADATYPAVAGSASFVQDTCNTGIMASQLESNRVIKNDGQGNITVFSSDGTTVQGNGPIRCNGGTLSANAPTVSDGTCRFVATYSVDLKITADNTFNLQVTQGRSNVMSEPGKNCTQPANCTVIYKVAHKM